MCGRWSSCRDPSLAPPALRFPQDRSVAGDPESCGPFPLTAAALCFSARFALQVASLRLLALDGFKQCLEVALAEAAAALALDDLVEERGAVFDGAGKDLEHVAFVIAVDQDAELFQLLDGLVDLSDAALKLGVVGVGNFEEAHSLFLQFGNG